MSLEIFTFRKMGQIQIGLFSRNQHYTPEIQPLENAKNKGRYTADIFVLPLSALSIFCKNAMITPMKINFPFHLGTNQSKITFSISSKIRRNSLYFSILWDGHVLLQGRKEIVQSCKGFCQCEISRLIRFTRGNNILLICLVPGIGSANYWKFEWMQWIG